MLRYALTRSGGGPRHGALLVLRLHGPEDASYCGRCIVSSLPFSRSVAFKYHTDRRNIREYCPQVSRIAYFRPFLWRNSMLLLEQHVSFLLINPWTTTSMLRAIYICMNADMKLLRTYLANVIREVAEVRTKTDVVARAYFLNFLRVFARSMP